MARRYENIELNGRSFTLDTKEKAFESGFLSRRSVNDVYGKCSSTKKSIWNEWLQWFTDNDGYCGVASHSCNFFSIEGFVTDSATGKRYHCYITHSNNRCTEVEEV